MLLGYKCQKYQFSRRKPIIWHVDPTRLVMVSQSTLDACIWQSTKVSKASTLNLLDATEAVWTIRPHVQKGTQLGGKTPNLPLNEPGSHNQMHIQVKGKRPKGFNPED